MSSDVESDEAHAEEKLVKADELSEEGSPQRQRSYGSMDHEGDDHRDVGESGQGDMEQGRSPGRAQG